MTATNLLAALAPDVRRSAYELVGRGEVSPKEIAKALDLPLPNTSYHVGVLRDAGLLELARTEPRRGAVEHFYRQAPGMKRYARRVLSLAADLEAA